MNCKFCGTCQVVPGWAAYYKRTLIVDIKTGAVSLKPKIDVHIHSGEWINNHEMIRLLHPL